MKIGLKYNGSGWFTAVFSYTELLVGYEDRQKWRTELGDSIMGFLEPVFSLQWGFRDLRPKGVLPLPDLVKQMKTALEQMMDGGKPSWVVRDGQSDLAVLFNPDAVNIQVGTNPNPFYPTTKRTTL